MVTLKIGRRLTAEVASIKAAQDLYHKTRDKSHEGASSFPEGRVVDGNATYRISYNGRIWDGSDEVVPS